MSGSVPRMLCPYSNFRVASIRFHGPRAQIIRLPYLKRAISDRGATDTRISKSHYPKRLNDRLPHPPSRVRETKASLARITCSLLLLTIRMSGVFFLLTIRRSGPFYDR